MLGMLIHVFVLFFFLSAYEHNKEKKSNYGPTGYIMPSFVSLQTPKLLCSLPCSNSIE